MPPEDDPDAAAPHHDSRADSSDDSHPDSHSDDVAAAYDELAPDYEEELEDNPYNEHIDFPGTTALVPEVDGIRILDAGCGAGRYTAWLLDQGADVIAVDASEAMVATARDRLQPGADGTPSVEFRQAYLADGLDFLDDNSLDGIVSGLVFSYVADWDALFEEFARVLRPSGFVVFSTGHPANELPLADDESYFETRRKSKEWTVELSYYARPLEAMVTPPLEAGFRLERLSEPQPTEGFREAWPERYEKESRYPVFVAFRFRLPGD